MYCSKCGNGLENNSKFCGLCGYKLDIEEQISEKNVNLNKTTKKKRGGLLTAWLYLNLIGSVFSTISYVFFGPTIRQFFPGKPEWVFSLLTVYSITGLIFFIAIYKWNKWGVYGSIGIWLISLITNFYLIGLWGFVNGLIGLLLAIFIISRKWDLFE